MIKAKNIDKETHKQIDFNNVVKRLLDTPPKPKRPKPQKKQKPQK